MLKNRILSVLMFLLVLSVLAGCVKSNTKSDAQRTESETKSEAKKVVAETGEYASRADLAEYVKSIKPVPASWVKGKEQVSFVPEDAEVWISTDHTLHRLIHSSDCFSDINLYWWNYIAPAPQGLTRAWCKMDRLTFDTNLPYSPYHKLFVENLAIGKKTMLLESKDWVTDVDGGWCIDGLVWPSKKSIFVLMSKYSHATKPKFLDAVVLEIDPVKGKVRLPIFRKQVALSPKDYAYWAHAIEANGKWVLASFHGQTYLFDTESRECKKLPVEAELMNVSISDNGDHLLYRDIQRKIWCWDIRQNEPVQVAEEDGEDALGNKIVYGWLDADRFFILKPDGGDAQAYTGEAIPINTYRTAGTLTQYRVEEGRPVESAKCKLSQKMILCQFMPKQKEIFGWDPAVPKIIGRDPEVPKGYKGAVFYSIDNDRSEF